MCIRDSGNGADLNQVEFLRYLKDDPETSVVAVYIETVNNGQEFMDALKELTAVKPVIALKSGRSSSGMRAALSHTGSMAGADAVYDAAFRSCGAIRVDSLDELIDLCKGFSYPVSYTHLDVYKRQPDRSVRRRHSDPAPAGE